MPETASTDLTEEHEELRRTVRSLLEKHSPEAEVRRVMATEAGWEAGLWRRLADTDLTGLAIPEEYGGAGYGWLEMGVVAEEVGRSLACVPWEQSSRPVDEDLLGGLR